MFDVNSIDVVTEIVAELEKVVETAKKIEDSEALQLRDKIVGKIPAEIRFLYPEDDTLAALAFAEVYYSLHLEDE